MTQMKTVKYNNNIVHIVNIGEGICKYTKEYSCFCGSTISKLYEPSFNDMFNEVPTCPKCIENFYEKMSEISQMEYELNYFKISFDHSINLIDNMIGRQRHMISLLCDKKKQDLYNEGSFPFIPEYTKDIFNEFKMLKSYLENEERWSAYKKRETSKFLDAGCGIGNIMLLAREVNLCSIVHGLEYSENVYKIARQWLGINDEVLKQDNKLYGDSLRINIFKRDILRFRNYGQYDIIYFFCPFNDSRLQIMFEEKVEDAMKVGAILVPHLRKGGAILDDNRFEKIHISAKKKNKGNFPYVDRYIYLKIKSGKRKISERDKVRTMDGNPKVAKKYKFLKLKGYDINEK